MDIQFENICSVFFASDEEEEREQVYETYEEEIVTRRTSPGTEMEVEREHRRRISETTPYYTKKYDNYWAGREGPTFPDTGSKLTMKLQIESQSSSLSSVI